MEAFSRYRGIVSLRPYDHKHHILSRPVELKTNVRKPSQLCPDDSTVCPYTRGKALSAGSTSGLLKRRGCARPPERLLLTVRSESCLSVLLWGFFSPSQPSMLFAGRNAPESADEKKKEKSLSHPVAHSDDPLRADSHLRRAGPRGCVLASWQVPSVKQGLCVLAV